MPKDDFSVWTKPDETCLEINCKCPRCDLGEVIEMEFEEVEVKFIAPSQVRLYVTMSCDDCGLEYYVKLGTFRLGDV